MATSDALVVVEDWISEHYFTAEAKAETFHAKVVARRKEWDAADADGLETPRSRFLAVRRSLETDLADLYEDEGERSASQPADTAAVNDTVRKVLGYRTGEYAIERRGPVEWYATPGVGKRPLVIIDAIPLRTLEDVTARHEKTLPEAYQLIDANGEPDGDPVESVASLLSLLFLGDNSPEFALVLAGRWLVVASRERWAEGRYLGIDLQLIAERNDTKRAGEIDRALTCVAAASLAPDADGNIWWSEVLEDAVKHTVGVSKDLRDGVRRSIEIIANEVVARRQDQGLDPLPPEQAQPLAVQALRYLYRILFLLYAEASPELRVLPVGAPEYDQGYSLDRLRELVLVELTSARARNGTHFHESLATLFRMVDQGHGNSTAADDHDASLAPGIEFNPLRADLFRPQAIALIDEVGLGNQALQEVLRHLLLSKSQSGKERGFISYVDLGINQLGAVYEGLMSYTGFFASEELFEVAKDGNAEKGSWVVPVDRAERISEKDFVRETDPETGERRPVRHDAGSFVFRLSGRERQRSASYYTPEVLTRFTVSQALEELLDQDEQRTTADEILQIRVCEPALGSGAFAIEAVRQLADQYLSRRQAELDERIAPEDHPTELQRVKAHIALHQVYGVDLNATAVELAEISLWLDTMAAGLEAPWFGLRLRRGNSLIGARHATYTRAQVNDKSWLVAPPIDVPLTDSVGGRILHFLLPAKGWGSTVEAKEARELSPDASDEVKQWRKTIKAKPSKKQLDELVELTDRAERLWEFARRRLEIAEEQSRRNIPLWGSRPIERDPATPIERSRDSSLRGSSSERSRDSSLRGSSSERSRDSSLRGSSSERSERVETPTPAVTREQIEESLADVDGAYQRLRLVMDAWCALWFWPLHGQQRDAETRVQPPSLEQWISCLQQILGRDPQKLRRKDQESLAGWHDWESLGQAETDDLAFALAQPIATIVGEHPWLTVCRDVAAQEGFFHWALDFAPVFERGGFDLQVGNPPWVRPDVDVDALLAEGDPWWELANSRTEALRRRMRDETLSVAGVTDLVVSATAETVATREMVSDPTNYPALAGLRPDLYRCFMAATWSRLAPGGVVGLIHPESHFTDERAGELRAETYRRLRRHWQFVNELKLFEIHHLVTYGVHVYGAVLGRAEFKTASGLYHPDTVERSLLHDGLGPEPGFKDAEGHWDLRAHGSRIQLVDDSVLATWHALLETESVPVGETRMLYTVNRSAAAVLAKLAGAPRLGSLGLRFSPGWNEKTDRTKGFFVQEWGVPSSWRDAILQGPNLHVNNPYYKAPNKTMLHNLDWSAVDLETLAPDAIPVTAYKPAGDRHRYDAAYTHWGEHGEDPARDHYRVAWRRMAANTGERTLIPAIIPPGAAHVNAVLTAGGASVRLTDLVDAQAVMSSLLADFSVRSVPKGDIYAGAVERLPRLPRHSLSDAVRHRTLRLGAVTSEWKAIWDALWSAAWADDSWTVRVGSDLASPERDWSPESPLRNALDRRQAQVEIDALVALMLGVTADELCTVYRTQFAVLYGYDHWDYTYDANGRLVPNSVLSVWRKKGDAITEEERTATNQAGNTYVYELPFRTYDREEDMRVAYAEFERRMAQS